MAFRIRRIVTARDVNGKAFVGSDSTIESSPGNIDKNISAVDLWWTHAMPVDVEGHDASSELSPKMPTPGSEAYSDRHAV